MNTAIMLQRNIVRCGCVGWADTTNRETAMLYQIATVSLPTLIIAAGMIATRLPSL